MNTVNNERSWYENNWYTRAWWELKFALLPHRCHQTNKLIWLRRGYRGDYFIHGPGEPVVETRWHTQSAHLIWLLQR